MKRYLSLMTGMLAVLGSLYFLFLSLLAGFLLLMWAGVASVLMSIVAVGIPIIGCLSGAVSVIYFFYPSKIKFYYTFPSWITVLALAYVLFLGPGLDCMIKAGEIRAFIEENNRDIPLANIRLRIK